MEVVLNKKLKKKYLLELKNYEYKMYYERYFFIITSYALDLIIKLSDNFSDNSIIDESIYLTYVYDINYVLDNINNRRSKLIDNDFYKYMQNYYSEYIEPDQMHYVIKSVINDIINHECYKDIQVYNCLVYHFKLYKKKINSLNNKKNKV